MQHEYTSRQMRQIDLVARLMDIGNRGGNTFEALLSRRRGVPAPGSRLFDELVLSAVFLVSAPLVLAYLSRASGRPFLELTRELVAYARQEETATPAAPGPKLESPS
jgi:hypothetical protein